MLDPFVLTAPFLLLLVVALLQFVGCNAILGLGDVTEAKYDVILSHQLPVATVETANSNNVSAQLGIPVAEGNLIIVWLFYDSAVESVQSIMDNSMNEYAVAVGPTTGQGLLSGLRQEIWYAANVTPPAPPGTKLTVTATFSATFNARKAIVVHDYSGAETTMSPLDRTVANVGMTTADDQIVRTGALMASKAELVFAAAVFHGTYGEPGEGFGARSTADDNLSEDLVTADAESVAATFKTQPLTDWVAQMATFIAHRHS
jgi:hypothetical protein